MIDKTNKFSIKDLREAVLSEVNSIVTLLNEVDEPEDDEEFDTKAFFDKMRQGFGKKERKKGAPRRTSTVRGVETQAQIAQKLGISQATVSRTLHKPEVLQKPSVIALKDKLDMTPEQKDYRDMIRDEESTFLLIARAIVDAQKVSSEKEFTDEEVLELASQSWFKKIIVNSLKDIGDEEAREAKAAYILLLKERLNELLTDAEKLLGQKSSRFNWAKYNTIMADAHSLAEELGRVTEREYSRKDIHASAAKLAASSEELD